MASPNIEGTSVISTYSGGPAGGATVGVSPLDPVGFHGNAVVQSTGYGVTTGGVLTASFPGATATLAQTSEQLAYLINDLVNKGIIGQ